ncbi:hypothetical protein BKA58DRAFT_442472 [Alternaria rosae]|uniref:uncharacterized protein n=1 Tax=Alternaria rosae TaxID=1187941 RepID=UPI001E8D5C42|nr:uncharacterized protein BKA58DRAFT_442472 [Alternaria rosae]KAH6865699.1 hypothetical protein BKA58DRAFT_442472 [Alternaria rosae]
MPPIATTSASSGTPTAIPLIATPTVSSGFNGEEFINNLGSDLAPLLTLFGEQVTKQFLSMSLGWADHILLAVGPLGIITIMVSAIRVSNVRTLKAIVGRAREKIATAELELLSSTSYATSELWTEEGVVRQPGHAKILEMVVYKSKPRPETPSSDMLGLKAPSETIIGDLPGAASEILSSDLNKTSGEVRIGDLNEACNERVLRPAEEVRSKMFKYLLGKFGKSDGPLRPPVLWMDYFKELASQPPNLTLNIHNTFPGNMELWGFVLIGIALQLVAIGIPAAMTYYWRKPKGANPVQHYAYPTFLVGTCLLVVSIAMCSYIIEATSVEHTFAPTDDFEVKDIFRLQLEQNMGDQPFKAYVILNDAKDKKIRTSRYDPKEVHQQGPRKLRTHTEHDLSKADPETPCSGYLGRIWRIGSTIHSKFSSPFARRLAKSKAELQKVFVTFAVILCFAGFVCQFVGLRALHWSATVIQLGITLLMTCIRAWIRRGVSYQPKTFQLPDSNPNWIALVLGTACQEAWPKGGEPWPVRDSGFHPLREPVKLTCTPYAESMIVNDPRVVLRKKLQAVLPDTDSDLIHLCEKFQQFRKSLRALVWRSGLTMAVRRLTWAHVVECRDFGDHKIQYNRLEFNERVQENDIHALLALWRFRGHLRPVDMSIVKAFSEEDWKEKCNFFKSRIKADRPISLYSTTRSTASQELARGGTRLRNTFTVGCIGLSIDAMQDLTVSSGAREHHLYGYLICPLKNPVNPHPLELLAGFMDALWHQVNLKYNDNTESWYSDFEGFHAVIDVGKVVNIVMKSGLLEDETDAEVLVYSSLLRCTKWKHQPDPDVPVTKTDWHPDFSPPTATTAQSDSQQQDQQMISASATAPVNQSPQTDAATTINSRSKPRPTPSIPISTVVETVQEEKSLSARATTAEASLTQHTPKPITPVPSVYEFVQAETDKGELAAISSAAEHQSTSTARLPVVSSVRAPEMGESSRTGAQMAEAAAD